jgi:plastocyanin
MDIPYSYTTHINGSKSTLSLLLLVSVALMVSEGCAVKQSSVIDAKSTVATQTKPTEIKITSTEFNYNPARIKVKEGQAVTFTLDNSQGAIEHDFVIKELGIH